MRAALSPTETSYPPDVALNKGEGLTGWVIARDELLAVREVRDNSKWVESGWSLSRKMASYLGVPIRSMGKVIGALVCLTEEPRDWPEGVVEAVSGLAAHAAIAIENARAYEETRIRSEREEALRKVTRDITQNLDLTDLFSRICKSVSELLDVEITYLFLLDEETGALNVVSAFGEKEGEELPNRTLPKGKGITYRVASRKEHVAVAEVLKDPDWVDREWAERAGIQSFLGIPLILGDRVVGVLNALTKQVRNFKADEIGLLRDFADQAAVALDNARAFSQISQKSFQIEKLNEINRKLASAHELNEILETILEASKDLVGGRCAVVYLHDEANGCLVPRSRTRGGFLAEVNLPPMKLGEGLLGWVARERQPLVVQDAQADSRWVPKPWNQNLRLGPFAGLPLVSRDSLFGVLAFFSEADHALSEEEFHLLASFADQAAIAIEKAQQVESLKARIKEQEGLVSALGHVASGLDVERVIQAVLSESARVMGTNRCSVMLPDPQSGELRLVAGQGISQEFVEGLKVLPEPFPIGRAYLLHPEKDEPTVIQEVGEDPVIGEVQAREGHRTLAAFPLRLGDRNIGSLFYFWTTPQTVDEQKLLLGQAFAEQVAIAVQNSRLFTEARERATNLEILDEIAKAINSTLDLEEIFKISLEQLKRVVPCDESTLYILGADKMVISDFFLDSDGENRRRWIESQRDLTGSQFEQIFKMKKPLYFPDARKSPYSRHQSLAAMGLRSALHAPIVSEGACVGFLSVGSPEVNAFTDDHINLLQLVADHLALAMRNAELFSRAETRATNLEIVDEIAKAIDSTLDLEELFKITVEQVKRMVPSERSSLFIVDSDKGIVSHAYFVDVNENRGDHLAPRKLEETYFEQVIKTKQPLYTRDTAEGSHPRLQMLAAAGLRSLLNVPVLSEGECIGSLNVTSSEANAYTDEHIELLQSVADHLAVAMKNAELYAEVRETSERLDSFVRSASDGIATVDLEARITSWNPGMEAIYGYSEKEMHGEHILRIYPEEKGEFKKFWGRLILGEIVPPTETVRQRKDGTLVEVSVTVSPIRDSTGQVVGISGIHRDIGAKKRAEEALRKSEGKYRTLFEEASDAIEIVDEKGRIVDCNQHACDLLGYTREEMLKKQLQDIVAPEYRDSVRQRVTRIIDEGMIPYESANLRKDGSVVPIEVSAASIEIEGRKRVIYFLRDITERKQAEEELRKTQAQLYHSEKLASIGTLVAGVAHEILNPTHIISLQVQMLQKGMVADAPEKMDETYRTIEGQVKRITRTTRNLLQFARQREPQVKSLDIREVLNPLVKLVEDQYRVENVELVLDYAQELPPVDGDEDQLTQVFLNLISNAKDAMPDGGRITLRARSSFWNGAPWIQISVEDTGKGIRDDVLKRIFDPFYTTKPEGKGTGLGLSVSYGIVEGHGGKLTVESREGKGTTLLVELPASEKGKAEET